MKRDSLVKGTFILSVAALFTRFLAVIQRFPLIYLLGTEALGSYGIAFNLYSTLLIIGTAGIPSALSKMISEKISLGRQHEANKIFRAAILFAVAIGIIMSVLLFWFAPYYAIKSGDPHATLAARAIAPALLIFPLISIMRGYFQGRQHMLPNALSQITEQFVRLTASLLFAYLLIGVSKEWAVAGASFGGVPGGVAALLVIVYYLAKLRAEDKRANTGRSSSGADQPADSGMSYPRIYLTLLRLSIPIVIFSMTVTLMYTIDSSSIIPLLSGQFRTSEAKDIIGNLVGIAQPLAGLPIILAIALSQSIVPIISSAYSRKDQAEVKHQTAKVLQLSILTGVPMVLAICIAANPLAAVFDNGGTEVVNNLRPAMIILVTASAMFQLVMQTSGAVLMGMGKMRVLILTVVIGITCKLLGNLLLSQWFGIYGILVASLISFFVMCAMNLHFLRREVSFQILNAQRWMGLLISVVAMIAAGSGVGLLMHQYFHLFKWEVLNQAIDAVLVGGVVILLYPPVLMITRVVTKEHFAEMPLPLKRLLGKAPKALSPLLKSRE